MGLHPTVRGSEHLYASGSNLRFRLTSQRVHLQPVSSSSSNLLPSSLLLFLLPENIFTLSNEGDVRPT